MAQMPPPAETRSSPCPHYPECVGCALIGTRYGEQLELKRRRVIEALSKHPELAHVSVPEVVGSPKAFGYRNQAKLVARRAGRGLLLGIYRPGTHQVVDITRCPVHDTLVAQVLGEVAVQIERRGVSVYDEPTGEGWLRYVVVRSSGWKRVAQIILVARDRGGIGGEAGSAGLRDLVRALTRIRAVSGIVLNVNPAPGNAIFGPAFFPLTGKLEIVERIGGLELQSRAGAFLQANIPVARRVYERALEWADPQTEEVGVDLYCGAGAISFHLATRAGRVFGIEESPLAVLDAKANIRRNGFHNVRFIAGVVSEALPELASRLGRIDLITLNPPRKGADEETRRAIAACEPSRIVYVSCDPGTLARDLAWFASAGYATAALQPFDMLPQTEHVECVALLTACGSLEPTKRAASG